MPKFEIDPAIGVSHTADKSSFAYSTVRERWPKIIKSAEKDVEISSRLEERTPEEFRDGHAIVKKLERLLSDLAQDAKLQPLIDDGGQDIAGYNIELQERGNLSWQNAPWLYLECYLYRLVQTFFSLASTPFWRQYDVFANTKNNSLPASKAGTIELVVWFMHTMNAKKAADLGNDTHQALLEEMLEISLWGNATDLSLLTTISMEDLHSRQGKAARQASKKNVIVDDTKEIWALLHDMQNMGSSPRQIHIVLDNSGFELLADLVLAVYLLSGSYTTEIVLHGKCMPWFVSDVTARDFDFLIDSLVDRSIFEGLSREEAENLHKFGLMLKELVTKKKIAYEAHLFWTTQHSFGRISQAAPDLFDRLTQAELVIFKGDLNYRKLVADGMWPKTTSFKDALGLLGKKVNGKGMNILALRGCKADVVVGLKPGLQEQLEIEDPAWTRTGRYAVISYCNSKNGE